jgi:hypothetical protein
MTIGCGRFRNLFSSSTNIKQKPFEIGSPTDFSHVCHIDINNLNELEGFIKKQEMQSFKYNQKKYVHSSFSVCFILI